MYAWLHQLFFAGYRTLLSPGDLYALDRDLGAEAAAKLRPSASWGPSSGPVMTGSGLRLAWALAKALTVPILVPVAPRLAMAGFIFSQPFFLRSVLEYLQQPGSSSTTSSTGYGLIGAGVLIHLGISLSSALYAYYQLRALCKLRSCLGTAVYKKVTEATPSAEPDGQGDGGATGAASLTLVSTDVERVARGALNLHEFWASTFELGLGLWLLQRQLGMAFLASVITVVACAALMIWMSRKGRAQQRLWMSRI